MPRPAMPWPALPWFLYAPQLLCQLVTGLSPPSSPDWRLQAGGGALQGESSPRALEAAAVKLNIMIKYSPFVAGAPGTMQDGRREQKAGTPAGR